MAKPFNPKESDVHVLAQQMRTRAKNIRTMRAASAKQLTETELMNLAFKELLTDRNHGFIFEHYREWKIALQTKYKSLENMELGKEQARGPAKEIKPFANIERGLPPESDGPDERMIAYIESQRALEQKLQQTDQPLVKPSLAEEKKQLPTDLLDNQDIGYETKEDRQKKLREEYLRSVQKNLR